MLVTIASDLPWRRQRTADPDEGIAGKLQRKFTEAARFGRVAKGSYDGNKQTCLSMLKRLRCIDTC